MKPVDEVVRNQKDVLVYLKSRFPMYHLSNFFFRDIQYGIRMYLREKGIKTGYAEAESIARTFIEEMERLKIFRPIDRQSWVVNYPEFRTPPVKPAAKPASPPGSAPGASSGQKPAAGPAVRETV